MIPVWVPETSTVGLAISGVCLGRLRVHQRQKRAVTLPRHILPGNETERGAVDAIAQPAANLWAILKHMAQMGIAYTAAYLRANPG